MNKIQKMSSYLLILFNALLVLVPLSTIAGWAFLSGEPLFGVDSRGIDTPEGYVFFSEIVWTTTSRLLGFASEFIELLPFLLSLLVLKAIFKNYRKGIIFCVENAVFYRRLGALFLLDALLVKPIAQSLMVLAVTLQNPPGHRYLTIAFGTVNFSPLFYGVLIIVVSWVMLEASKIHEDQKLTV